MTRALLQLMPQLGHLRAEQKFVKKKDPFHLVVLNNYCSGRKSKLICVKLNVRSVYLNIDQKQFLKN